jgi:hypothetical protein
MKLSDVTRVNKLLGELEEFLNERGATLLNSGITVAENDYGLASAAVKIDITDRVEFPK